MNWRWIDQRVLMALHDESLVLDGGAAGLRDVGLLESALARPANVAAYSQPDAFDIAAAYAVGLSKNHPFIDGNKRAAFLSAGLILRMNGHRLVASQADATVAIFSLAAGEMDEASFVEWLRRHSRPT